MLRHRLTRSSALVAFVLGLTSCTQINSVFEEFNKAPAPPNDEVIEHKIRNSQNALMASLLNTHESTNDNGNFALEQYFEGGFDPKKALLLCTNRPASHCKNRNVLKFNLKHDISFYPAPGYYSSYGQLLLNNSANIKEVKDYFMLEIKHYPEFYDFALNYLCLKLNQSDDEGEVDYCDNKKDLLPITPEDVYQALRSHSTSLTREERRILKFREEFIAKYNASQRKGSTTTQTTTTSSSNGNSNTSTTNSSVSNNSSNGSTNDQSTDNAIANNTVANDATTTLAQHNSAKDKDTKKSNSFNAIITKSDHDLAFMLANIRSVAILPSLNKEQELSFNYDSGFYANLTGNATTASTNPTRNLATETTSSDLTDATAEIDLDQLTVEQLIELDLRDFVTKLESKISSDSFQLLLFNIFVNRGYFVIPPNLLNDYLKGIADKFHVSVNHLINLDDKILAKLIPVDAFVRTDVSWFGYRDGQQEDLVKQRAGDEQANVTNTNVGANDVTGDNNTPTSTTTSNNSTATDRKTQSQLHNLGKPLTDWQYQLLSNEFAVTQKDSPLEGQIKQEMLKIIEGLRAKPDNNDLATPTDLNASQAGQVNPNLATAVNFKKKPIFNLQGNFTLTCVNDCTLEDCKAKDCTKYNYGWELGLSGDLFEQSQNLPPAEIAKLIASPHSKQVLYNIYHILDYKLDGDYKIRKQLFPFDEQESLQFGPFNIKYRKDKQLTKEIFNEIKF